ncbi:MAG: ABC transporter ATP-binding protein [Deltaproteobacteria bacterium]|nr:ABC transporter ATP-binding protein [Deltaproteobacteria bacterium]
MATIHLRSLSRSFPTQDGQPLPVLVDVDLTVRDRQFACLLGPSGCGKSTLLNIIAGLIPPSAGSIEFEGQDPGSVNIGYIFQEPRLLNWRTVADNLDFALRVKGVPRQERPAVVERYLKMVGLDQFKDAYPLTLSGGMQSRVGIARAFAIRPDVLLMDEPFSNLDELTARQLRRDLLDLWEKERLTVLFITHNAMEAVYLGDVVHIMSHRPAEIFSSREVPLPRPRDYRNPEIFRLQQEIVDQLMARVGELQ